MSKTKKLRAMRSSPLYTTLLTTRELNTRPDEETFNWIHSFSGNYIVYTTTGLVIGIIWFSEHIFLLDKSLRG